MAKKKDDDDAIVGTFILGAIFLAVMFISSVAPLIYLGIIIYYRSQLKGVLKNLQGNNSDFWFDNATKNEISQHFHLITQYKNAIDNCNHQGSNLSRRQDGAFDERSNLGKSLNKQISDTNHLLNQSNSFLDKNLKKPQVLWNLYHKYLKHKNAGIFAFLSWIIAMGYLGVKVILRTHDKAQIQSDLMACLFTAFIFSLVIYGLSYLLGRGLEKYTPKPPKATQENLYLY